MAEELEPLDTDVRVVAPMNIGKGIKYNPKTKQYEVALGAGLTIDQNGVIQLKANKPEVKAFDNGTGKVWHNQVIIDYGEVVEVSGSLTLPMLPVIKKKTPYFHTSKNGDFADPEIQGHYARYKQQIPGYMTWGVSGVVSKDLGLSNTEDLYYCEVGIELDFSSFGITRLLSLNATAGDVQGWRSESAWIVGDTTHKSSTCICGVHVYRNAEQNEVSFSYTVKGVKE